MDTRTESNPRGKLKSWSSASHGAMRWLAIGIVVNAIGLVALTGFTIITRIESRQRIHDELCQTVAKLNSPQLEVTIGCPVTPPVVPVAPSASPTSIAPVVPHPTPTGQGKVNPPVPAPPVQPAPRVSISVGVHPPAPQPQPTPASSLQVPPQPLPTLVCVPLLNLCL